MKRGNCIMFRGETAANSDCYLFFHRSGEITLRRQLSGEKQGIETIVTDATATITETFDFFDHALTWGEQKMKAPVTPTE